MDIRNFLDSPTTSKASHVSKLKKAAASKGAKNKQNGPALGASSPTAAEVKQAKKIVAAAAKAKK